MVAAIVDCKRGEPRRQINGRRSAYAVHSNANRASAAIILPLVTMRRRWKHSKVSSRKHDRPISGHASCCFKRETARAPPMALWVPGSRARARCTGARAAGARGPGIPLLVLGPGPGRRPGDTTTGGWYGIDLVH